MAKPDKKTVVKEIKAKLESAQGVVLTDFRGLNVFEINDLRRRLAEHGIEYKVMKNTLVRIAADECGLQALDSFLEGPTALAFGFEDPVLPAKMLSVFSKQHELLKIKAGILNGEVLDVSRVIALANLPAKDSLLAMLLSCLQAPLAKFRNVLDALPRGLVTALDAIVKQKEA